MKPLVIREPDGQWAYWQEENIIIKDLFVSHRDNYLYVDYIDKDKNKKRTYYSLFMMFNVTLKRGVLVSSLDDCPECEGRKGNTKGLILDGVIRYLRHEECEACDGTSKIQLPIGEVEIIQLKNYFSVQNGTLLSMIKKTGVDSSEDYLLRAKLKDS